MASLGDVHKGLTFSEGNNMASFLLKYIQVSLQSVPHSGLPYVWWRKAQCKGNPVDLSNGPQTVRVSMPRGMYISEKHA